MKRTFQPWLRLQRLDSASIDPIGRAGMFVVVFALGWLLMIWGWGAWLGGLIGWVPAWLLAAAVAPAWRGAMAGGAALVLLLLMGRLL